MPVDGFPCLAEVSICKLLILRGYRGNTYIQKFASFHTIEHQIGKSAPFQVRAKLEPLSIPLQNGIRFLLRSSALYAINSLRRASTFLFSGKEHIGFTKVE